MKKVPKSVGARLAVSWAEAVEGSIAGHEVWGFLARYCSKMLMGPVPKGMGRVEELERRLEPWGVGSLEELIGRVAGQQAEMLRALDRPQTNERSDDQLGRATRKQSAAAAGGKAVKGLAGGVASGSAAERERWTVDLILRGSGIASSLYTTAIEKSQAGEHAWGEGDTLQARGDMREAGRVAGGPPRMPWVRLPPLSAPGPCGERPEHLGEIISFCTHIAKRRLARALDALTLGWATNTLPASCWWLLKTQVLVFTKRSRRGAEGSR